MSDAADQVPVQNASAEDVRAMIDAAPQGALTVLDVRMEHEYEEFHLPGATLLPLPDLSDRLHDVPRDRPVVTYCRSGKRSAAAASLLAGAGFPKVVNMLGGVQAWQGAAATGPPDAGMTLLDGTEKPRQILLAALCMEAALGAFYGKLTTTAGAPETRDTFTRLAGFEERHLHHVHALYRKATGDRSELASLLSGVAPELEGGLPGEAYLAQLGGEPQTPQEALELAAAVEAQALDLYGRLAARTQDPEAAALYRTLAQEEKAHLRAVSNLMNRLANS